jgi:hypothetical protein
MLIPLKQFICDACKNVIEVPEKGWLEWITDPGTRMAHSFHIVHHFPASPKEGQVRCYLHHDAQGRSDEPLASVMSSLIPNLLMHLDVGAYHNPNYVGPRVGDMRNYVEIFRRLTIPYYEEARLCWEDGIEGGDFDMHNEVSIFQEEFLKELIRKYSKY